MRTATRWGLSKDWNPADHPRDPFTGRFVRIFGARPTGPAPKQPPPSDEDVVEPVDPRAFALAFSRARENDRRTRLKTTVHDPSEYTRAYLSPDGKTGVALIDDEVVNLFNNGGRKGAARGALRRAVADGGRRLDASGEFLRAFYESEGFEVTDSAAFDRDLAPSEWRESDGREPIYFMARKESVPATSRPDAHLPRPPMLFQVAVTKAFNATPDEARAAWYHGTMEGARRTHAVLRGRTPADARDRAAVGLLDSLIARGATEVKPPLWHGIDLAALAPEDRERLQTPGAQFTESGYFSTSRSARVAGGYPLSSPSARGRTPERAVMMVTPVGGAKALDYDERAHVGGEVLFPRGSQIKVTGVLDDPTRGRVIAVEVGPPESDRPIPGAVN